MSVFLNTYFYKGTDKIRILDKMQEKIIKDQADQYLLLITEIIDEGKRNGEIKEAVISGIAAASFFSQYYSVLLMGLNEETFNPDYLVAVLKEMIDQTIDGIGSGA